MQGIKQLFRSLLVGGLLVIAPIAIILLVFRWLFRFVTDLIQPITDILVRQWVMPEVLADVLVIVLIASVCLIVGTVVRTRLGRWMHERFDSTLGTLAPGYRMIKEILMQFMGDKESSPFANGSAARVWIYGREIPASVTALVTSIHADGLYTVFVPTGPNPTSGFIYHVAADCVELLPNASVEQTMRSIIACGVGSDKLLAGAKPPMPAA